MSRPLISKLSIAPLLILAVLVFGHAAIAHALTISPARIEVAGDPGTVVGGEFTLINEQASPQTFYASYENFTAQGETGTPSFSSEKVGLASWLATNPTQITLEPGRAVKMPYSITIPKDAEPGGYFAAVFWSTTPPSTQSVQVSIGAKIGMLILLRVNGDVTEAGGITQFDRNGHGFFYTSLPVSLRYKFRNDGADRVEPKGTVTIRDTIFIKAAALDANAETGNILPGSVRQFTVNWPKEKAAEPTSGFFNAIGYQWQNFALGLYSAHLKLAYGTQGLSATKTVWLLVFPWQLVICIVLVLFIILKGGSLLLRRYNRYIIRKAQQSPRNVDNS
jgi:hypothetical protein